jgi:hypothetical protein
MPSYSDATHIRRRITYSWWFHGRTVNHGSFENMNVPSLLSALFSQVCDVYAGACRSIFREGFDRVADNSAMTLSIDLLLNKKITPLDLAIESDAAVPLV